MGSGEQIAEFEGDTLSLLPANPDQWLFYSETGDDFKTLTAVAQRIDGNHKKTFPGSEWFGFAQAGQAKLSSGAAASRVYRAPDLGDLRKLEGLGGKRLLSMAADTPDDSSKTIDLSAFPMGSSESDVSPASDWGDCLHASFPTASLTFCSSKIISWGRSSALLRMMELNKHCPDFSYLQAGRGNRGIPTG